MVGRFGEMIPRKALNHNRSGPKLPSASPSIVTNLTLLDYFLILFPMDYVKVAMIPGINRHLPEGGPHVSEHDFIIWLGMWLVVGCYEGNWGRQDWWSKDNILIGRGAPFRLNEYMSRGRFNQILAQLK